MEGEVLNNVKMALSKVYLKARELLLSENL